MTTIDRTARPRLKELRSFGELRTQVEALESAPRITPAEAFDGRKGYDDEHLGEFMIPLPEARGAAARDVLRIPASKDRLDYQHFSVVMSKARRIAMLVACNVDGKQSRSIQRDKDRWAYDGRIPLEAQVGEDLYSRNDLDRGHLVRREDPNWGTEEEAEIANDDTFHFTNCSPQMAAFNQKTWLGLENYVLQNARAWKDRVTVFTGPVFLADDSAYRDVPLPTAYWKVLAFLSDTGRPSATAYMIDQRRELRSLEAAYGRYKTYQRSIRQIESLTGLSFGALRDYDGFSNEEVATGTRIEAVIDQLDDIRV